MPDTQTRDPTLDKNIYDKLYLTVIAGELKLYKHSNAAPLFFYVDILRNE
jgi:hypothetical protein